MSFSLNMTINNEYHIQDIWYDDNGIPLHGKHTSFPNNNMIVATFHHGLLHSYNDEPALITKAYSKEVNRYWFKYGMYHRENSKPALEIMSVTEKSICRYYYQNNKKHREDGPAVELGNHTKRWYIHGKRHRLDGPAIIEYKNKIWYIDDKEISPFYAAKPDIQLAMVKYDLTLYKQLNRPSLEVQEYILDMNPMLFLETMKLHGNSIHPKVLEKSKALRKSRELGIF